MSGATLAQGIAILAAPFLTRLYGPAAFGALGLFIAVTRILTQISGLRYELAIMLPEKDEDAAEVFGLAFLVVLIVGMILIPISLLAGPPLARWLHATELIPYLGLIPVSVLFGGALLILNYWHTRHRHFGRLSLVRMVQSGTQAGTQLGVGMMSQAEGGGLIGGVVMGQIIAAVSLVAMGGRGMGQVLRQHVTRRGMMAAARRYRKFPRYNVGATLMNSISWQLPTFFLSFFFSPIEVGFFALGNRVIELPMRLVGSSIAQVFFQRASAARHEGKLDQVVLSTFRYLVTLSLFPLMLLFFVAPELFQTLFGDRWREAGVYTQILTPWIFFWFISSPMSTLFSVLEKQEWSFRLNAAILLSRFLALGLGGWLGNPRIMLGLFALSGVLLYGFLSIFVTRASGVIIRDIVRSLWEKGWPLLPAGGILIFIKRMHFAPMLMLLIALLFVIFYFAYQLHTDPQLRTLLREKRFAP